MEYLYLGKIVNTHGIKGELRILSDFKYKDLVFIRDFKIYIGDNKEEKIIDSYRPHKNYDMVIFKDIFNIDDVLKYKGKSAYINKDDLKLDNNMYLDTDLMGIKVYDDDKYIGIVTDIMEMPKNDILVVMSDTKKKFLIPYIEPFIKNIDIKNNKIIIESIEGMIE
jgi:16S rRNA processing protein RimM